MRERAKLIGGKLTVRSEPGSGTRIDVTVPAALARIKASSSA
jgi:signal transduction histidine kinase